MSLQVKVPRFEEVLEAVRVGVASILCDSLGSRSEQIAAMLDARTSFALSGRSVKQE